MMTKDHEDPYDRPCTHSYLLSLGLHPDPALLKYTLPSSKEPVYHRDHTHHQLASTLSSLHSARLLNQSLLAQLHFSSAGAAEEEMKRHLERLHEYNELRDAGQALIGRLAVLRETTTKALYPEFGLHLHD